jgi:hypothetical protein
MSWINLVKLETQIFWQACRTLGSGHFVDKLGHWCRHNSKHRNLLFHECLLITKQAVHSLFPLSRNSWAYCTRSSSSSYQRNIQGPSCYLDQEILLHYSFEGWCRSHHGQYWPTVSFYLQIIDWSNMHVLALHWYLTFQIYDDFLKAAGSSSGPVMIVRLSLSWTRS